MTSSWVWQVRQGTHALTGITLYIFGPALQESQPSSPFKQEIHFDVRSDTPGAEGTIVSGRLSSQVPVKDAMPLVSDAFWFKSHESCTMEIYFRIVIWSFCFNRFQGPGWRVNISGIILESFSNTSQARETLSCSQKIFSPCIQDLAWVCFM